VNAKTLTISIVGSGNVAHQLAQAFYKRGLCIYQIVSRDVANAADLAASCKAKAVDFKEFDFAVDVVLLCVKDDSIKEIASRFKNYEGVLVHSSGSVRLDVLSYSEKSAVFYPFVSMVKGIEMDFEEVDIYVEGSDKVSLNVVKSLALLLSSQVSVMNSSQRAALHLSAVFAQNFTNHLMVIASDLLQQQGLDYALLRPLLSSYFQKLNQYSPAELQTGPAVRKDGFVIESHLTMLENDVQWKLFYEMFTKSIQQKNK